MKGVSSRKHGVLLSNEKSEVTEICRSMISIVLIDDVNVCLLLLMESVLDGLSKLSVLIERGDFIFPSLFCFLLILGRGTTLPSCW